LFSDAEEEAEFAVILERQLDPWWGRQAGQAAAAIGEALAVARGRPAPFEPRLDSMYVDQPIQELEAAILANN
jgi:hypothetical protein